MPAQKNRPEGPFDPLEQEAIPLELKLKFNEDARNYDLCRPTYTPALFEAVLGYAQAGPGTRALEIGPGTGQATTPFLDAGCNVTAVELGENLAAYIGEKFAARAGFRVIHGSFEAFVEDSPFDLIYSATAFHWIAPETGYPKLLHLLRPGGTAALFWNHPCPAPDNPELGQRMHAAYEKYCPGSSNSREFQASDMGEHRDRLQQYGFEDVRMQMFRSTRRLDAEQYVRLMNTYSNHRALEAAAREDVENVVRRAINDFGGTIEVRDTMDLYLGRKP